MKTPTKKELQALAVRALGEGATVEIERFRVCNLPWQAMGVREGQRVDRGLLKAVADEAVSDAFDTWLAEGGNPRVGVDTNATVNRVLQEHTAAAESEYERGVREGLEWALAISRKHRAATAMAGRCRYCRGSVLDIEDEITVEIERARTKDAAREGES